MCMGNARPIDSRPQSEVQVGPDKLEVVASYCYLDDMLLAGGSREKNGPRTARSLPGSLRYT